jgi:hypothetical protein
MKRIYFAGSVGANDWRNDLTVEKTGRIMSDGYSVYTANKGEKFIYGGPFAISDDHGCFHGSRHGCQETKGCSGSFKEFPNGPDIPVDNEGLPPKEIFDRCLNQIKNSDAVFAYIKKEGCYGTYFEIGYAHALGIPIYLYSRLITPEGIPDQSDFESELWFVKLATKKLSRLEIPEELLTSPEKQDYHKYLNSPEWKEKARQKRIEAGNKCQLCNSSGTPLNVHHRTYENIYQEKPEDLIVLCKDCHQKFHDIPDSIPL